MCVDVLTSCPLRQSVQDHVDLAQCTRQNQNGMLQLLFEPAVTPDNILHTGDPSILQPLSLSFPTFSRFCFKTKSTPGPAVLYHLTTADE